MRVYDGGRGMILIGRDDIARLRYLVGELVTGLRGRNRPLRSVTQFTFTDNYQREFTGHIVVERARGFIEFRGEFENQNDEYGLRIPITDLD